MAHPRPAGAVILHIPEANSCLETTAGRRVTLAAQADDDEHRIPRLDELRSRGSREGLREAHRDGSGVGGEGTPL